MATVEYYLQTVDPQSLKLVVSESFGYVVEMHPADFESQIDKPDVPDLSNWYRIDSYEEWTSDGHAVEVGKILDMSSFYDNVVESHDAIQDAFWRLGQGLNNV